MLQEGTDFYFNENGLMVLTAAYHLKRGRCCGNGCLHCPYDFINVKEPKRSELLKQRQEKNQKP
ncbi:DUF5522 domain-containing protein [Edaphocola aurantiacus]|uniref:DUF5522 domain-containing protein n=1 Tax=Edaphocola aurantiacus TaxID=2601682 RepID=UPI000F902352|nr:DUF5522 domain-containing protein [Edaphocola aurantiacus]